MASFLLFARWARPARRMGCAVERHFGGGAVTVELARGGFGVTGEFAGDFANLAETPGGVAEFTERVPFEGTFGLYLFDERFFEGVEFGTVFGRDFHDGGGKAVGLGIGGRFGFSGSVREPVECWALAWLARTWAAVAMITGPPGWKWRRGGGVWGVWRGRREDTGRRCRGLRFGRVRRGGWRGPFGVFSIG